MSARNQVPAIPTARPRRRRILTAVVWTAALASVAILGLITAEFVFMATSMDPSDLITDGTQSWTDALSACLGFGVATIATILALRSWHSERYQALGLILVGLEIAVTGWVCVTVYREYF